MATKTLLTIDDFEKLPEEMARNHELEDGELVEVSGNVPEHNLLKGRLNAILDQYARARDLGVVIPEQEYAFGANAHGPDISFFVPAKRALVDFKKRIQRFTPDLAIEIISESDTAQKLLVKKDRYRRHGVSEVWIISIETRELFIYSEQRNVILTEKDHLSTPLLPGFSISLEELFQLSRI
jgi:Uma2 family endonuclease